MLTERDIEQIEEDLGNGIRGEAIVSWVRRLLADREERILHEREVAVRLLADAPSHPTASHGPSQVDRSHPSH